MSAADRAKRIAELNDQLRTRVGLPGLIRPNGQPTGLVMFTRGLIELDSITLAQVCARVRSFSNFTPDNDPYGEHDFGSLQIDGAGRVFWKIDYYADASCRLGSEDPSDPEKCFRVLTIMLADEY